MDLVRETLPSDIEMLKIAGQVVLGPESERIEKTVEELIQDGRRKFIVDISEVPYVDSSGLGILVGSAGRVREAGGQFRIVGMQDSVRRLFRITEVDVVLELEETVEEARADLSVG